MDRFHIPFATNNEL